MGRTVYVNDSNDYPSVGGIEAEVLWEGEPSEDGTVALLAQAGERLYLALTTDEDPSSVLYSGPVAGEDLQALLEVLEDLWFGGKLGGEPSLEEIGAEPIDPYMFVGPLG